MALIHWNHSLFTTSLILNAFLETPYDLYLFISEICWQYIDNIK